MTLDIPYATGVLSKDKQASHLEEILPYTALTHHKCIAYKKKSTIHQKQKTKKDIQLIKKACI